LLHRAKCDVGVRYGVCVGGEWVNTPGAETRRDLLQSREGVCVVGRTNCRDDALRHAIVRRPVAR
jgi:hypothetical protein